MNEKKRFHFLLIYPLNTAPSQRFRFEQYFPLLEKKGIKYSTNCFYNASTFSELYGGGKLKLGMRVLFCFFRRCIHLFSIGKYDRIFIQRGAAPFGPPFFEWIIHFLWRKEIIYDFDDAIWMPPEKKTSFLKRIIKAYHKVGTICKWSHTVVVGNEYLAAYARRFNENVIIIPTVVDTKNRFIPLELKKNNDPVVIGWTGSHTTLSYLEDLEPALLQLQKKYPFELMVMANKPPHFKEIQHRFVPWSEEAEVAELNKVDIGLMPLTDDEWTRGKCGFKLIQYLALEIPAVANPVGVNGSIIEEGENGLFCTTNETWKEALNKLLTDPGLRQRMGKAGRKKVIEQYSLDSQSTVFTALFI